MQMSARIKAVQYHPGYCPDAKADADAYGIYPWRWDSSHDLSIIDENGKRHYIGSYKGANAAIEAGLDIERSGIITAAQENEQE